jgi:hypothetical protein
VITIADDLARTNHQSLPLGQDVWVNMYDLREGADAYRRFAAQADQGIRPEQRKREYVERLLEKLPRHQLFPPARGFTRTGEQMNEERVATAA